MSTSSGQSATMVATAEASLPIIPMHLHHHTVSASVTTAVPPTTHATPSISVSTAVSSATCLTNTATAAAILQANAATCDNQIATPSHNLIAHTHPHSNHPPPPPPTTIYVQNYATATPIIVHPTENATTTYMAKLTPLPPS